jgi:hypothetical protein
VREHSTAAPASRAPLRGPAAQHRRELRVLDPACGCSCDGRRSIIGVVADQTLAGALLVAIGLPDAPTAFAPARDPPQVEVAFDDPPSSIRHRLGMNVVCAHAPETLVNLLTHRIVSLATDDRAVPTRLLLAPGGIAAVGVPRVGRWGRREIDVRRGIVVRTTGDLVQLRQIDVHELAVQAFGRHGERYSTPRATANPLISQDS